MIAFLITVSHKISESFPRIGIQIQNTLMWPLFRRLVKRLGEKRDKLISTARKNAMKLIEFVYFVVHICVSRHFRQVVFMVKIDLCFVVDGSANCRGGPER